MTTTDQPLEGEWKKVLSRKKSTPKKPSRASTPKEQPMSQRRRTPPPPTTTKICSAAEVACTASTQWKGGKDHHRSWKGFSTSREVWPGWVISGTTKDRRKYYIVKANRLPSFEEEINVDLPAYFMHIHKEKDPRHRWLFVKGPTSKSFNKKLY